MIKNINLTFLFEYFPGSKKNFVLPAAHEWRNIKETYLSAVELKRVGEHDERATGKRQTLASNFFFLFCLNRAMKTVRAGILINH